MKVKRKNFLFVLTSGKMRCLLAVTIVLSLLFGWSCAQAPEDAQSFCTETLPSIGVNILDYSPEVKPLMDSRHYQQLLPPNTGAVWQEVDNDDNNNRSSIRSSVSFVIHSYVHSQEVTT